MDEARRSDRAGPDAVARAVGMGSSPGPYPSREVRIDRRALAAVALLGLLAVPALLGLKALQDRSGRSTLLLEARRQRDEAGRPELALAYFNRYLELAPDDLDAADQRAALLAGAARDPAAIEAAARAHVLLLGKAGDAPGRGAARKRLAGLHLRLAQFRAAEQASRDHLRLEPADVEGRRLLARALEGAGRMGDARALEAAAAEYEAAEALEPGDVASGERLAALYLDKFGDRAKATRVLDALLEHNPRSAPARLARARSFAASGDPRAASAEVEEAIRLDPADVDARLAAAEIAANRGDPAVARRHLDFVGAARPDDLRLKVVRGLVELADHRVDLAIRDWRDGLALSDGTDAGLTWRLAHVLIQLGRPREAGPLIAQYRRLSGGDEMPPAGRYLVGLASLRSGRTAEAVAELEAIRYRVDGVLEAPTLMALGRAYEASREPAKAAEAYAKATTSPGSGADPWLALAGLQPADRPAERAAALERGIAAVGPDGRLLAELARALWRVQAALPADRRDWAALDQALKQGEEAAPRSVGLALVRADRAATSGRVEDGLAVLEAAIGRDPASTPLRVALAEALARVGRVDEATARLGEATATIGDRADFRVVKARLALDRGRPEDARAALLDGLDKLPADQRPALARALGDFHSSQKDRPAARRAFLEWAALEPDSIDPHLALLNLAVEEGDDRAIDLEVRALKAIDGPAGVTWKVARAEALLRDRPASPAPLADVDEAARLVAEIRAASPRLATGHLLEGRLRERRGEPDRAIRAYEKAVELEAGPLATRPLAALLAKLGRPDSPRDPALRRVDRVESLGLDERATLEVKARVLKARGEPLEAVALVEAAFDPSTASAESGRGLVRLLAGLGEVDAAGRMARRVGGLGPLGSVVLAEWLASRGDFDGASAAYEVAGRDHLGARESARSALALASTGREPRWPALADRLLDRAIGAGPVDDEMLHARASLRHLQGRLEEAVGLYDELAGRLAANHVFLNNAAWILSEELGRPAEGLGRIEALAARGTISANSLDTRGVILLRLGQVDRAIADLEAAASEGPSGPIYYHLARAHLAAGRRDEAARALAGASAAGLAPEALQPSERAEFARVTAALR